MLNALQINQKNYALSTFPSSNRRNFVESGKVLVVSVSEFARVFCSSALLAHAYKIVTITVCVQRDNCFCNTGNLCPSVCVAEVILWHAFVSHLGMFSKIK